MKKLLIPFMLLSLALFIFSCQEQQAADTSTPEPEAIPEGAADVEEVLAASTKDTISLDSFTTWRTNWERNRITWIANNKLDGFNLPLVDLESVLGENPDSSRFYIGLESNGSGGFNAKLMVVGVKAGKDMIDYANGEYVYDLSSPCPPFCGNE